MSEPRTFMGMTIEGDVSAGTARPAQRPAEEFLPIVQGVLGHPLVSGVKWTQYTPYFNDGDACIFGANGPALSFVEDDGKEVDEDSDDWDEDAGYPYDEKLWVTEWSDKFRRIVGEGEWLGTWAAGDHRRVYKSGGDETLYNAWSALQKALEGGEFDDVLQVNFGEHSVVHFYKGSDKIRVEFYDHD